MSMVKIGVVPLKRGHTDLEPALKQKKLIRDKIKEIKQPQVKLIEIEDVTEKGILYQKKDLKPVTAKLKNEEIDGLFVPHCDFGTEELAARLGNSLEVPFLLWGPRDEAPDPETGVRARDNQCGIFATSKVLQRYGIPFSYIINSEVDSEKFENGFKKFNRVAAIVKNFQKLRIAQISTRPRPFLSVMVNEDELLEKFGIEVIPLSLMDIIEEVKQRVEGNNKEVNREVVDIKNRINCSAMKKEDLKKIAALKLVLLNKIKNNNCNAAALECWSLFPQALGIAPCFVVAELTDMKIPVACETDIQGAITSLMLQSAALEEQSTFFADLTIRHPDNDNAELLWHCGPFPYSLKAEDSEPALIEGKGQWELQKGDLTLARFDAISGEYSLFAAEAEGIAGPYTEGTYLWFEVDDWPQWEEKFIFGPYIHHIVGIHGQYAEILHESCKYIPGLKPDSIQERNKSL